MTWDTTVLSTLACLPPFLKIIIPQVILLLAPQNLPSLRRRPIILVSPRAFFLNQSRSKLLRVIVLCSLDFLTEVDRRLSAATGDARKTAFLFQRFNAVLVHESFVAPDVERDEHVILASVLALWHFTPLGKKITVIILVYFPFRFSSESYDHSTKQV